MPLADTQSICFLCPVMPGTQANSRQRMEKPWSTDCLLPKVCKMNSFASNGYTEAEQLLCTYLAACRSLAFDAPHPLGGSVVKAVFSPCKCVHCCPISAVFLSFLWLVKRLSVALCKQLQVVTSPCDRNIHQTMFLLAMLDFISLCSEQSRASARFKLGSSIGSGRHRFGCCSSTQPVLTRSKEGWRLM